MRAVLDACVLVPSMLADHLLTVANRGLFRPAWSQEILNETVRNIVKVSPTTQIRARHRVRTMQSAFPDSLVDLVPGSTVGLACHPKDRHVLAAAIVGEASMIVTANVRDFPDHSVEPFGIEVRHPDVFLQALWKADPAEMAEAVIEQAGRYRNPPLSPLELCAALARTVPNHANVLAETLAGLGTSTSSAPAFVQTAGLSPELNARLAGGQIDDPLVVAFAWVAALREPDTSPGLLELLTYDPQAFGDFAWARDLLEGLAMTTGVRPAVDAPTEMAFVQFVPNMPPSMVFEPGVIESPAVMTLVKLDDGAWRVWGLGPHRPSRQEVLP